MCNYFSQLLTHIVCILPVIMGFYFLVYPKVIASQRHWTKCECDSENCVSSDCKVHNTTLNYNEQGDTGLHHLNTPNNTQSFRDGFINHLLSKFSESQVNGHSKYNDNGVESKFEDKLSYNASQKLSCCNRIDSKPEEKLNTESVNVNDNHTDETNSGKMEPSQSRDQKQQYTDSTSDTANSSETQLNKSTEKSTSNEDHTVHCFSELSVDSEFANRSQVDEKRDKKKKSARVQESVNTSLRVKSKWHPPPKHILKLSCEVSYQVCVVLIYHNNKVDFVFKQPGF